MCVHKFCSISEDFVEVKKTYYITKWAGEFSVTLIHQMNSGNFSPVHRISHVNESRRKNEKTRTFPNILEYEHRCSVLYHNVSVKFTSSLWVLCQHVFQFHLQYVTKKKQLCSCISGLVTQAVKRSPPTAGVTSSRLGHFLWVSWWTKRGLVRFF